MPALKFNLNKKYSELSTLRVRVGRHSVSLMLTQHQMIIFQLVQISTNWRSNFMSHMLNKKNQIGS